MSLSKVSPFYSSAPSMFTDSQPKLGTDSVLFYIDFGSHPIRFGRFTVSQIFRNGQNYSEPTFQVFKKDKCGTFEKYQTTKNWRLRIQENLSSEERSAECRLGNSRRTQKWKTCCSNVTKQERSALEKIEDSTLPLYSTLRTIQLQFLSTSDYFVAKRAMSSSK